MYNDDLSEISIPIAEICLDPNNPRFWSERTTRIIPDVRIPDTKVQSQALTAIQNFGIEELRNSILRNGFLPLDRIVVRKIRSHDDKYVVVEGNRRLAALITLRQQIADGLVDEEHVTETYLERLVQDSNQLNVLLYQGREAEDISWVLQGIRHISGIRDWEPAQRARLVADQIENGEMSFSEAGQKFGLTARAVGRYYRSYKALQQMREDDEFSDKARNDYFSLFEEALRNKAVRDWLEWSEEDHSFNNGSNLQQFYSWITPDPEHDNKRRIHDPKHVKHLGALIDGGHAALRTRVDEHEIDIESAVYQAQNAPTPVNWTASVDQAVELIKAIPADVVRQHAAPFLEKVAEMEEVISGYKTMAEAIIAGEGE